MRRIGAVGLVLILIAVLVGLAAGSALGGATNGEVKFEYWPAYVVGTINSFQFGSWYTGLWGIHLRMPIPNTPLWWNFEYLGGSQSGQSGSWIGSSGSDKLVRTYLSYLLINRNGFKLAANAGWGKMGWDTDFGGGFREVFRSSGIMLGLYAQKMLSPSLEAYGKFSYHPWNSVRLTNSATFTSMSDMKDWQVGLRYLASFGDIDLGYRSIRANTGDNSACPDCSFRWQGWFIKFGIPFK